MINDSFVVFYWWILISGLGIPLFPLTWLLFKNFFDLGYPFAKILAILVISSLVWLAGSLKILPFSTISILLATFIPFFLGLLIVKKFRKKIVSDIGERWKVIFLEEIIFFIALFFWSYVRGFQPDIEGLEKFMDFGFINSILRSEYFPPADIWMAGKTINYYYFGHLIAAILTKISSLDSAVTYNLMIATIFALTFTATFSLVGNMIATINNQQSTINLKKIIAGGLLSALFLTLGGNLHTLWWFLTHNFSFAEYWYPDATRFIVEKFGAADNTIHEFPIYSFVVSDLHGHVSNIPFVLLFLGLLFLFFATFSSKQTKILEPKLTLNFALCTLHFALPLALVLAVMYMTNSWDFPIYFLILGVSMLWLNYQRCGLTLQTLSRTFLFSLFCFLFSILLSLPFHLHFSQIAQGIDLVHARSPFWQLLVLWGYQWITMIGFSVFLVLQKISGKARPCPAGQNTDTFILILLSIATLLIVLPEIVYVKDIYIDSYHRANTVFKFVYQSFMLYALASGYILVRLWTGIAARWAKFPFYVLCSMFYVFLMIYPYFAISSYYGNLKKYKGLNGLGFLARQNPDDFAGISWLAKNVKDQPVVLEAAGDSYTDFNRVSMATGLPTVEGWLVHEWLWRGSFDEPGRRAAEVETIFSSSDLALTENLIVKYDVKYVFIGSKEREKYKVEEEKFKKLGTPVFAQGYTEIYQFDKLGN